MFYLETQHQLNFELQNRYADNSLLEIISQPTPQIPSSSFIEIQKQVPIYIFEDRIRLQYTYLNIGCWGSKKAGLETVSSFWVELEGC